MIIPISTVPPFTIISITKDWQSFINSMIPCLLLLCLSAPSGAQAINNHSPFSPILGQFFQLEPSQTGFFLFLFQFSPPAVPGSSSWPTSLWVPDQALAGDGVSWPPQCMPYPPPFPSLDLLFDGNLSCSLPEVFVADGVRPLSFYKYLKHRYTNACSLLVLHVSEP